MPLSRSKFVSKFQQVMPLQQYPTCYHGGYETLTLKLDKSDEPDGLAVASISFPPFEAEGASKYGLYLNLFFVCALPEGVQVADRLTHIAGDLNQTGSYSERVGDVVITGSKLADLYFIQARNAV